MPFAMNRGMKNGGTLGGAALLGLSLWLQPVLAQTYAGWSTQARIILNTGAAGANVAADVKGFPVPLALTEANFDFSKAKPKGEDLRFSDAAGPALPYEIESWDAAA